MTKKEFRQKCRKENTLSCKLTLWGGMVAVIGLILVIATLLFLKPFGARIMGFVIGGGIAVAGMALDAAGEILLARAYKDYRDT